jgi:hypothetical protein
MSFLLFFFLLFDQIRENSTILLLLFININKNIIFQLFFALFRYIYDV